MTQESQDVPPEEGDDDDAADDGQCDGSSELLVCYVVLALGEDMHLRGRSSSRSRDKHLSKRERRRKNARVYFVTCRAGVRRGPQDAAAGPWSLRGDGAECEQTWGNAPADGSFCSLAGWRFAGRFFDRDHVAHISTCAPRARAPDGF